MICYWVARLLVYEYVYYVCVFNMSDLNGNEQRDAGSDMRSKMSGISSATRIRSIRRGRGLTELQWRGFGKRPAETRQFMIRPSWLAWGKPLSSTRDAHQMARKVTGSCMSIGLNLMKMDLHRQASSNIYIYIYMLPTLYLRPFFFLDLLYALFYFA